MDREISKNISNVALSKRIVHIKLLEIEFDELI